MVWTLFPFKGDFSFREKPEVTGCQIWALGVTWVIWCFTKKLQETWGMSGRFVMMKLPVTSCPQPWPFSSCCISQPMKNIEVIFLINCLAWRGILVMTTPSRSKNTINVVLILLWLCRTFFWHGEPGDWLPQGQLGLCFWIIAVDSRFILGYDLPEEIWFIGSSVNQIISNCSKVFLPLW